ncbi:SIR2 family protein [Pontibacter cellulosilyticus]|uniref:SIR2 family protein n=1 Tax=Pontibacter cellulosilyticus TaxID=1720253 RepID=A0A923N6P0_9BACT|nr:SIR2 family protein [Pontibacter cellulosilyticus]MBC5992431.1 SIR2 family protein [Pontibacter cellulosilyticus]
MNDQVTSVSYSVYSNKGAFALLLGSGISRSAGIPTGWEVVLNLIRHTATLKNENCEPDPEKWFTEKFKKDPDYSDLLESLTNTPAERLNLLRPLFEPNEEDLEDGLKKPTVAHRMIAELVRKRYIRVVITTNFDRLLENALKDVGIEPTVISNPGHVENTMPIVHSPITIIKIHGDYLDTSLLNIKSELYKYDDRLGELLRFVFENFGLITCGWSATWDIALRQALESSNKFRFSNYFTYVGKPVGDLENLASIRKGHTVAIDNADTFFKELHENVEALENSNSEHPLTPQIALARLKKYIVRDEHIISLHDLIKGEVERVYENFDSLLVNGTSSSEEIKQRIEYYFQQCSTLCTLFVNGVYWGKEQHYSIWLSSLARFSSAKDRSGGTIWLNLETLPGLIFLYSIGLSSILRKDYKLLSNMFSMTVHRSYGEMNILEGVSAHNVIDPDSLKTVLGNRNFVPMSEMLFSKLQPFFDSYMPHTRDYENLFDIFEYMLAIAYTKKIGRGWSPIGRFGYRIMRSGKMHPSEHILHEFKTTKEGARLFSPSLFADFEDLEQTDKDFKEYFSKVCYHFF